MIVFSVHYTGSDYLFFLENLGIISGYLSVAFTLIFASKVLPVLLDLFSRPARFFGSVFFSVASLTRFHLAWRSVTKAIYVPDSLRGKIRVPVDNLLLTEHLIQVVSLWVFILLSAYGFLRLQREEKNEI